jgi:hypothetical protein
MYSRCLGEPLFRLPAERVCDNKLTAAVLQTDRFLVVVYYADFSSCSECIGFQESYVSAIYRSSGSVAVDTAYS